MSEYSVDIYHDPGMLLRAETVLKLAERHGIRSTVELLLPYTVTGPGYVRGVFDALRTALRMFNADRIDEGVHWLGEAVIHVPRSHRTFHRPCERPPGMRASVPDEVPGAAERGTSGSTRRSEPETVQASGTGGAATTPAGYSQPVLFEVEQTSGHVAPAVEIHVYPAMVARTLARSTAAATYLQPEPGGPHRGMHLIGATPGGPEDRWRDILFTGADTGTITAVAVSDPSQVRPEHRLDDQRWQKTAGHVATIVDPHAPWVAFRTRPDSIVLFVATSEPRTVATPELTSAATTALHHLTHVSTRPPLSRGTGPDPPPLQSADAIRPPAQPSPARTPPPGR